MTAFNRFMRRVLTPLRCVGCGAPGPAICLPCLRVHHYAVEVEQRRSLSPTGRSA